MSLLDKILGSYSKKELKRVKPTIDKILSLEDTYKQMSESDLKNQTQILKKKLSDGKTVTDILPEAFAVCREAGSRVLNMRHFKSQIIGGLILSQGRIAEMKTGEGKTLVATLPAYLYGLTGDGVHIVTVNDYLAKRDSEWMGKIYRYLGLTVGIIVNGMNNHQRKKAYDCDITYATNNEIGFDYLRDNMCVYKNQKVQRGFNFALIDEVDSILIDEARTPLIISGAGDKSTELYNFTDNFAKNLKMFKTKELDDKQEHDNIDADYIVDEKAKTATLTPKGVKKAEAYFNLSNLMDGENINILHHINQAIRAHGIMKRDIDYVVKKGEVLIVDEFTGRIMIGRRYSEGLHQAIEAKENVEVASESKTLASITFQNLFRIYRKLSGMTGTAMTEESEFREIYKLDIVEIPSNKPVIRKDHHDVVYKTQNAKFNAVIDQVVECNKKGQPVLIGTISIEKSELLSSMLKKRKIKHAVLNAKFHELEAQIVAQAGKKGAVTIATNMAGRGTDIVLGGNAEYLAKEAMEKQGYSNDLINEATSYSETDDEEILKARDVFKSLNDKFKKQTSKEADEVKEVGGLFIIGTERHESRRIDNQLRGRAGRQGDPGESRFYLSLEDDLMRLFGGERVEKFMDFIKVDESLPIESKFLTKIIANAQAKIEGQNFAIRKSVIKFDDIMNSQREIIYEQRNRVLNGENMSVYVKNIIRDSIKTIINRYISSNDMPEHWNIDGLKSYFTNFLVSEEELKNENFSKFTKKNYEDYFINKALNSYADRNQSFGDERMRDLERMIILRAVDSKWTAHIDNMEELKKGIYLRSYAQKDPVIEYRIEGFDMFDEMVENIKEEITHLILMLQINNDSKIKRVEVEKIPNPVDFKKSDQIKTQPIQIRKKVDRSSIDSQSDRNRKVIKIPKNLIDEPEDSSELININAPSKNKRINLFTSTPNDDIDSDENFDDVDSDENFDDIDSDEHFDDIDSDEHFNDIDSDEHFDDVDSDEHFDDVDSDENFNDVDSDEHFDDVDSDEHFDDIDSDEHFDDVDSDEHFDDVDSDEHFDDVDSDEHFDDVDSDENFDDKFITDTKPIKDIDNESVKDIDNKSVKDIDNKSVKDIDNKSVKDIDNKPIKDIDNKSVKDIDNKPIKDIDNKPIKDIDNKSVKDIDNKPVKDIDNKPVKDIDNKSVKDIDNKPVKDIDNKPVKDIDNKSVKNIDNKSVKDIDNKPVKDIDNKSVKDIDNKPVKDIDNKPIKDIDNKSVKDIDNKSIKDIDNKPVKDIDNKSVKDIDNKSVKNIDNKPVKDIDNKSIKDIDNKSVKDIDNKSIKDINNKPIKDIDNKSIKDIDNKSVKDIDNKSIKDIDNKPIKDIDNKSVKDIDNKSIKDIDNKSVENDDLDGFDYLDLNFDDDLDFDDILNDSE